MRKVLSFVLVLALVLGSFSMAFADAHEFSDMSGVASEEAVNVLADLGVVAGYPDGSFRPAQIVTRAEMARLIVTALGLEDFAVGTTSMYPDMVQAPWAQGYVAYGTSIGFISGYPDGTFKPNQQVSYQEAASMLVRALGYTEAFLPGGWPAEWMIKANSLGIFDDVTMASGAALANRGNIAIMLYNALELHIGQVNSDNVWVAFTTGPADALVYDTMLARLGAEFKGAFTVLGSEDSMINLRPYVGKNVTAYTNDGDIISISEVKSTTLVGKFTALSSGAIITDGDVFKAGGVSYTVNVTGNTVSPLEFENGDIGTLTFGTSATYTMEAKVSGKVITDVYSVQLWSVTADDKFATADASAIADDQVLFSEDFILDNDEEIDLHAFELVGVNKLADISKDDVVYVYASSEGIRKIVVGTEVVTGEISRISSDGLTYTINGKAYDFVDQAVLGTLDNEYRNTALEAGDDAEALLDGFGDVYDIDGVTGTTNYAVILDSASGGLALNEGPALLKLFMADGTNKVFDVNDSDVAAVSGNVWSPEPVNGSIVKYGVNADGEISTYTTVAALTATNKTITAQGYYNGFAIAENAVLYTYDGTTAPAEISKASNYGVTTLATVKDTTGVDAVYVMNSANTQIIAMLITSGVGADTVYGVITDYASNNSSAGYEVEALIDGLAKLYDAKLLATPADMKKLIEFSFDTAGNVTAFDPVTTNVVSADIDAIDGYVVKQGSDSWTLASDVVVYKWSTTDSVFKIGAIRDMDDAGLLVKMYDTNSTADFVYDVVLVYPSTGTGF